MPELTEIKVTHRFRASPERVFDAFVDPDLAHRWQGVWARRLNREVSHTFVFEPEPDGRFLLDHGQGEFRSLHRPRRIVLDWQSGATLSTITLINEEDARGPGCVTTLYVAGRDGTAASDGDEHVWSALLLAIEDVIERRDIA